MNAGAMGGWIMDLVECIEVIDDKGDVFVLLKEDIESGYRYCKNLVNAIAIGAVFKLVGSEASEKIKGKINNYMKLRREAQPREPSAGCVFKNPEKDVHAGEILDRLGLKGLRCGGMQVSDVHANFIVNKGGGTSHDFINLVKEVRSRVKDSININLEMEVLLLGNEWDRIL